MDGYVLLLLLLSSREVLGRRERRRREGHLHASPTAKCHAYACMFSMPLHDDEQ